MGKLKVQEHNLRHMHHTRATTKNKQKDDTCPLLPCLEKEAGDDQCV